MSLGEPIGTTYGHLYTVESDFGDDYVIVVSKYFGSEHIVYDARTRPENFSIAKGYKSAQSLYNKVERDRAIKLMEEL